MRKKLHTLVLVALVAAVTLIGWTHPARVGAASPRDATARTNGPLALTFGVYRTDKATTMYRQFLPIVEALQEDLSGALKRPVEIELKIYKTYQEGLDSLVEGSADFVRFGPASYILAKERNAAIELLAMEHQDGKKRFKGVIVVRQNDSATALADLRGRSFAFGDENSTIGRYLAQAALVRAGIHANDLRGFAFLGRHDAVAAAVQIGDYDAGSLQVSTFEKLNKENKLRVLSSFENVTKPWVARAGLDAEVRKALTNVLIHFDDEALLKPLKMSGFMATSDEEYAFVREGMKVADEQFAGKRSQ
ncbi:MAG: PhnD/SsuA/transferrin family substrate-binding protein [Planctomycetota bacterium]